MTAKTPLNVITATRFSSSDYEKIKQFTAIKQLSISDFLRRLVLDYLDEQTKITAS